MSLFPHLRKKFLGKFQLYSNEKKLAIIGAGIAGLTLANLIKKFSDHEFMLYEKAESLPLDQGYGIQLSPNIIKILNKINFKKINDDNIFNPYKIDFYNLKNKQICDLDLTQFNTSNEKYTTLQRSTLIEFFERQCLRSTPKIWKKN